MPVYKSPSTSIRSVDIVASPSASPSGVPAIVVGTARRGRAFVPITVGNFDDFVAEFGNIDPTRFGPLAMKFWLSSRSAGTYLRLLGVGDGSRRSSSGENAGRVARAGFVVGDEQVQSNGLLGANEHAGSGGPLGRTYILGCFMSETNGSTIFSSAGIHESGDTKAHPIIRGVLMAPSGVHLALNTEAAGNNDPSTVATGEHSTSGDGGLAFGDILTGPSGDQQNIVLILNGFTPSGSYSNVITASLDPTAYSPLGSTDPKPIRDAFNTDPTKIEVAGHYLDLFYDVPPEFAVPTGTDITSHVDTNVAGATLSDGVNRKLYQTAFLLTSSLARNSGSATSATAVGVPNFENYENRFTNAFSPMLFSQKLEGKNHDLFRFWAKDDGAAGAMNYKITIDGIDFGAGQGFTEYPKFNVHVRSLYQADADFGSIDSDPTNSLETFEGVTLDPSDPKFISKVIGDQWTYYDFDKRDAEGQKLSVDGDYPGTSRLIRVQVTQDVREGRIAPEAVPIGFRGLYHFVTSGSTEGGSVLTGTIDADTGSGGTLATTADVAADVLGRVVQPPVPLRESLFVLDNNGKKRVSNLLTWGMQIENKITPDNPNAVKTFNTSSISFLKYAPDFHTNFQNLWVGDNAGALDVAGAVFDSDRFNNNVFSLERIEVITSSADVPHPKHWASAVYRRSGAPVGQITDTEGVTRTSRLLRGSDFRHVKSSKYYQFTLPLIGGFDGTNAFDYDKSNFTNNAVLRELDDAAQGKRKGPTFTAYSKAIEIFENRDFDASVLATPGIRNPQLTDEFLNLAMERTDMFYIMDVEERDELNAVVTGTLPAPTASGQVTDRTDNTRSSFLNNPRDTTYGAAFYPDVRITDPGLPESPDAFAGHKVPPTVAVLGMMSKIGDHEKLLGLNNGSLDNILSTDIIFSDDDIDEFYQAGINLIAGPAVEEGGIGQPFLRSQNTFQRDLVPMSRISTRRMMLFVRKRVKAIMRSQLFEQMNRDTYARVKNLLTSELASLQAEGMFRFAQIDVPRDVTVIKKDIENNTIRVKILIRPNDVSEYLIIQAEESL